MLKVVDGGGEPVLEAQPPRVDPLADLARRAAGGDAVAMRQLLRAVGASLLSAVRAIAGREASDVEDIIQETLVAFVQALPAFRGESSVVHYASRIAVRTAVAARKRRVARQNRTEALVNGEPSHEQLAQSPGEEAWTARRRELLRALLDDLPEVQAETFALRVALGYSMQEVADATEAPVNTVRSRLRLAKEALRKRIERDPAFSELLGGTHEPSSRCASGRPADRECEGSLTTDERRRLEEHSAQCVPCALLRGAAADLRESVPRAKGMTCSCATCSPKRWDRSNRRLR